MDLYVLRHGLAAARGSVEYPYDADRPLTPKGTRRMVRQARGLNALGLSLDVILTSPLVRALETAEIVHRELDSPGRLVESEALAPMGHPAKLIDQLAMDYPSAGNVMIVGHEPYLSGLISLIVSGDPEPMIRLKKGALCKLRLFAPRHGRCGWIEWSMTPRHMVKLA
jgi:phosphohistidine phosphatase